MVPAGNKAKRLSSVNHHHLHKCGILISVVVLPVGITVGQLQSMESEHIICAGSNPPPSAHVNQ